MTEGELASGRMEKKLMEDLKRFRKMRSQRDGGKPRRNFYDIPTRDIVKRKSK